ncbi:MAG: MBL fold metallo-hydrolase [Candidatus Delongbacteria bacterium]|nr:MBL fold metallo-hydrolase [Candidatus Delongbacteria bacterium]
MDSTLKLPTKTVNDWLILVDNHASSPLQAEHGFSILIRYEGNKILFDTGQEAIIHNAEYLQERLDDIRHLVISHGHYDHTGAIHQLLSFSPQLHIWANPAITQPHYNHKEDQIYDIGIPEPDRQALSHFPPEQFYSVEGKLYLNPRIGICSPIPRNHPLEDTGGLFHHDPEGMTCDQIEEESALWLETPEGLIIVTGCCHAGFINTCEHIRRLTGIRKIQCVIGGFHLISAGPARIRETGAYIIDTDIREIVACHCTGDEAAMALKEIIHSRLTSGYAGMHRPI